MGISNSLFVVLISAVTVNKWMNVKLSGSNDVGVLEGVPGEMILQNESSITPLLEACFNHKLHNVLLYEDNFNPAFFNLSTGLAGTVLQKLRNYGIRLAIVKCGSVQMSTRFSDLLTEESRGRYFMMFPDRDAAERWLHND